MSVPDPKALAEKIIVNVLASKSEGLPYDILLNNIESLLAEALEEALNSQKFEFYELHKPDGTIEKWSGDLEKRIKAEAYDRAAEVVKHIPVLAERIRGLKGGL